VLVNETDDVGGVDGLEDFDFVFDVLEELHCGSLTFLQLDFLYGDNN